MNINTKYNILNINYTSKHFFNHFFTSLLIISFLVFFLGTRADIYMAGVQVGYHGFRPIGYPAILYLLSQFLDYENIKYAAVLINGIFFSFIFSCLTIISKNFNSNNYLSYLIFFVFLCPLFYEVFVIRETLFYAALTLLIVTNFSKWEDNSTLYGIALGLLYIIRPTGIVAFLAFILVTTIFFYKKTNKIFFLKKFLNTCFWFFIIAGIAIGIIYYKFGVLIFSPSCTSKLNLFIGLTATDSKAFIFTDMGEYLNPNRVTVCQDIEYYNNKLKDLLRNISTLELFKGFIIKFVLYYFSYLPLGSADIFILDNNQIQIDNFQYSIFRILVSIASIIPSILALIVLGIRFSRKLLNDLDFFLIFYVLGHGAIYAITWPEARYRFPIDPLLLIYLFLPINKNSQDVKTIVTLIYNNLKKKFYLNKINL